MPNGKWTRGQWNISSKVKRWSQIPTKIQKQVANNLGIVMGDQLGQNPRYRTEALETYDKYYEGTQYDHLMEWDRAAESDDYIAVRKRRPRINYKVAKFVSKKVAAKIVGSAVFPKFVIEEDPEDTEFFRQVQRASNFRANLVEPIARCLGLGSVFVRYYLVDGQVRMSWANAKYCYPKFDELGELEQLEIRYVYEDQNEKDQATGKFKQKWYRLVLTKTSDVLYDNPEYRQGQEPQFQVVEQVDHGLGWVQGEWFRTSKQEHSPDGDSLFGDVLDFIDDLSYSLSQSSQAISYNQEPQLAVTGVDEDDLDKLIRSSQKAWNLGHKDAKAEFIESDMAGVEVAEENRGHNRNRMLEVIRVVVMDPEKIVGHAQSGTALEILHAPLVELVDELRSVFEPSLRNLLIKIGMTMLVMNAEGFETAIQTPANYTPGSLDITVQWPAIFPVTIEDINLKATVCQVLSTARIVSNETLTRWIGPDVGVHDVDEELAKIEKQPIINPFGTF
jgi:hypothetical protein